MSLPRILQNPGGLVLPLGMSGTSVVNRPVPVIPPLIPPQVSRPGQPFESDLREIQSFPYKGRYVWMSSPTNQEPITKRDCAAGDSLEGSCTFRLAFLTGGLYLQRVILQWNRGFQCRNSMPDCTDSGVSTLIEWKDIPARDLVNTDTLWREESGEGCFAYMTASGFFVPECNPFLFPIRNKLVALDKTTIYGTVRWAGGEYAAIGDYRGGFELDISLSDHRDLLSMMFQASLGLNCPAEWNPRSHHLAMIWNCCPGGPDPEVLVICGTTE